MSRCFPFPPPGHSLKRFSNDALIESIKLQKEKEKAKAERKKEKKIEKKEKAKLNHSTIKHDEKVAIIKHDEKVAKKGKRSLHVEGSYNDKRREDETEQLERSGLTEEHDQPVLSQNTADSSQNRNKRKRDASPSNGCKPSGNIIRIRLTSKNCKGTNLSADKEVQCSNSGRTGLSANSQGISTSGRTDEPASLKRGIVARTSRAELCSNSLGTDHLLETLPRKFDGEPGLTFGSTERLDQDDKGASTSKTHFEKKMRRVESLYKDLIQKLVPQLPNFDDDQEWLFGVKHQDRQSEQKVKSCYDISPVMPPTLHPSAQYLAEVDMYALPFTVPY